MTTLSGRDATPEVAAAVRAQIRDEDEGKPA